MPVILKNITDVEQNAFRGDVRITIPAMAEVQLSDEDAQLFLEQRPNTVVKHEPVTIPNIAGEKLVWMANISGGPNVPKHVEIQIYDPLHKKYVPSKIPVLTREPCTYEYAYEMGQVKVGENELGQIWESRGVFMIKIPPFLRVPVPESVADRIEMDCSRRMPESRPHMVRCRAPSVFEPNSSWSYDQYYAYAEEMDSQAMGRESMPRPQDVAKMEKREQDEYKVKLAQIVFFMLIDNKYSLPPEAAVKRRLSSYGKK